MSDYSQNIVHHKSEEKGMGLPYAIVDFQKDSKHSEDLFTPSLRDFHVIFWFKKGRGKYYIDFKEYEFEPNTLIMVSSSQIHYMEPMTDEHEIYSIVFKPDFLYRTDNDLQHLFNFTISDHIEGKQIIHLQPDQVSEMEELWIKMFDVYSKWEQASRGQKFYHWLCLLLLYYEDLQDDNVRDPNKKLDKNSQYCQDFNELLEQNFKTQYSVAYYTDQLALTNKTLARILKEYLKMTPKKAIDARRILEMKRLLRGTNQPIKEIAYEFGFEDPTNMVKYFKKHTGNTPLNFKHLL